MTIRNRLVEIGIFSTFVGAYWSCIPNENSGMIRNRIKTQCEGVFRLFSQFQPPNSMYFIALHQHGSRAAPAAGFFNALRAVIMCLASISQRIHGDSISSGLVQCVATESHPIYRKRQWSERKSIFMSHSTHLVVMWKNF